MKFPILILVASTLCSLRGPIRLIPEDGVVVVSKANLTCIDIFCLNLTTRVSGKLPAEGSLVIAKFDHGDRSIGVTFEMGRIRYEQRHQLFLAVDGCNGWVQRR